MSENIFKVLLAPKISEKTSVSAGSYRQYAFKVLPSATKRQIKEAVEELFSVAVRKVNVTTVPAKAKRFKNTQGKRKGWKKAYVVLEEGQELELSESSA
jgi:large subunit ribosomal protein L23